MLRGLGFYVSDEIINTVRIGVNKNEHPVVKVLDGPGQFQRTGQLMNKWPESDSLNETFYLYSVSVNQCLKIRTSRQYLTVFGYNKCKCVNAEYQRYC